MRQVTPGLAGRFIEELPGSDPTRNLALAALRHFFDALVTRHAVALNSFSSVRGKKHSVVDAVGLRDRAVLGVLTYTGARVGAISRLRRGDLQEQETQRVLRFREKGGKQREIPVRHDARGGKGSSLRYCQMLWMGEVRRRSPEPSIHP